MENINRRMRVILIDWISAVHMTYRLLPQVLFSTVQLIDKYCSRRLKLSRKRYQLVGVAALMIADKVEEPDCCGFLGVHDMVEATARTYTKEAVEEMLVDLCEVVDF